MRKVLVVDDDLLWAELMARELQLQGYDTASADSVDEAMRSDGPFDLLISDWRLGEGSALDILSHIRKENPEAKAIFVSGLPKEDIQEAVEGEPVAAIIEKPCDLDEMLVIVSRACPLNGQKPGD